MVSNFAKRGNPNFGPTPRRAPPVGALLPLGNILQQAFHESGQYPDLVLSAHAHSDQRITYRYAAGSQIPYLLYPTLLPSTWTIIRLFSRGTPEMGLE